MLSPPVKLAIVGCGAIAEQGHLPGAAMTQGVETTLLVDKDLERTGKLADFYGVAEVSDRIEDVSKFAEAAVIATPPNLHTPLGVPLLRKGIHCLVEKPLAMNSAECDELVAAGKAGSAILAAGMIRHFYRGDRLVKDIVENGILGKVRRFQMEDGYPYAWPSATHFILRKETAGGGVLMGLGSHIFDSMIWLFGEPESFRYYSDAKDGIEADCRVELTMPGGIEGVVELSRTRLLDNRYIIECEHGTISAPYYGDKATITTSAGDLSLSGRISPGVDFDAPTPGTADVMAEQLADFAAAVRDGRPPEATGEDARVSIALIEACYDRQEPLETPWIRPIELPSAT